MSWLDDIKQGKHGLFHQSTSLPHDYVVQLEKAVKGVEDESLDITHEALDRWDDLHDFIQSNNIELTELQSEQIMNVDTYIKKKTFDGNRHSLYKSALTETVKAAPMLNKISKHYDLESLFPDDYEKKLPNKGGWIIVSTDVPVEPKFAPIKFGVYYAKGFWIDHHLAKGVVKRYGIKSVPNAGRQYRVKISVNGQHVVLHTHEYEVIEDINEILSSVGQGYEMVKGGGDANIEIERVHYLMTRGIPREVIYMKLLATVNSMTFCMFKPQDGFVEALREELHGRRYRVIEDNPFVKFQVPKIELSW